MFRVEPLKFTVPGLTVQLEHGEDVVVADVEVVAVLLALVVGEHDGVVVGAVGEPERVADLVHRHGEEVHRHRVLEVNSIALLKSQQTFQQTFQQSFYSSVGHPVVLEIC